METMKQLRQKGAAGLLSRKIVLMCEQWTGYGSTVRYRRQTWAEAASYGAVAALVRSISPFGLSSPHTGSAAGPSGTSIPTAAVAISDAHMLQRMAARAQKGEGEPVRLQLYMEAELHPDVRSRNLIGELRGTSYPHEKVLLSGHIDSWDVGFGAMDDGGGVFISWQVRRPWRPFWRPF
eukprot:COSAG01_NODE_8939_length_2608_cov_1.919091_3_plen_179_part_00